MPSEHSIELVIEIRRKPFWKILLNYPSALRKHYRIFRKSLSVWESLYGACLMAGLSLVFPR